MNDDAIIFSPIDTDCQERRGPFYLTDFLDSPLWVAWRDDIRVNVDGTTNTTKVPYSNAHRKAQSDKPSTWMDLETAAAVAAQIGGSVGICLGIVDCVPGLRLGGVDLDCSRDPDTGEMADWAVPVIRRFASYTEVSPSRRGCKILYAYRTRQLATDIAPLFAGRKTGRQWKRIATHDHPPGIEWYVQARFFAVTGEVLTGLPDAIRIVEPDDLRWLVEEYGPKFKGKADPHLRLPISGTRREQAMPGGGDNSRSGRAYRWMRAFHCMGLCYTEARDRILKLNEDPDVAEWARTKGLWNNERELRRVYRAAQPLPGSVDDRMADIARTLRAESEM